MPICKQDQSRIDAIADAMEKRPGRYFTLIERDLEFLLDVVIQQKEENAELLEKAAELEDRLKNRL